MAKKQRRQVPQTEVSVSSSVSASATPLIRRTITTSPAEFTPDYSFVISDLKRIGMLAGSFLVILIALSFFLK
jgi:hypothetical protein